MAAQAAGIYPGLPLREAQARCARVIVFSQNPDQESASLLNLARFCARRFCPLAAPISGDGVVLESSGCAQLYAGGEAGLLRELLAMLERAGFCAPRAAVAPTLGAAHALARYGAARMVMVDEVEAAVVPLPLASLRLPPEIVSGLRELGFTTIGEVLAAPRAPLARRYGAALMRRLDQMLGAVDEPVNFVAEPFRPRVSQAFPEILLSAKPLERVLERLLRRLLAPLAEHELGVVGLFCVCRRCDRSTQEFNLGVSRATRDFAHLWRLLAAQVPMIRPEPGIEQIILRARTARFQPEARELGAPAQNQEELSDLIDVLAQRLPARAIARAMPLARDMPENAVRYAPAFTPVADDWPENLLRPPRLFVPPQEVRVHAVLPDHPPAQFIWRRRPYRVLRADGPERVLGEWWIDHRQTEIVRDYFQVEDQAGQRFWLFRVSEGENLLQARWFLHGIFG